MNNRSRAIRNVVENDIRNETKKRNSQSRELKRWARLMKRCRSVCRRFKADLGTLPHNVEYYNAADGWVSRKSIARKFRRLLRYMS